jgi:glycerol-3-phosphate dehydrogenase subunit C
LVLPDPKTTVSEAAARALPGYDPKTPRYYDEPDLKKELDRVYDVCHTCRLCFNLCGSFPALFDAVDSKPNEVAGMTAAEHEKVVDECYQCKMCFVKCPYTPPHEWAIDFPRLMLRADANRKKKSGIPFREKLLGAPEVAGEIGHATWPISNWMNEVKAHRWLFEKLVGVHREKKLPPFVEEKFEDWFENHRDEQVQKVERGELPAPTKDKVALFWTCYFNWNDPEPAKATVRVLERNGVDVAGPPQVCCGMPSLDQGDVDSFLERARENLKVLRPLVDQGRTIVVPQPTCGYVLKSEYVNLLGGEDAKAVAAKTMDVCEYLVKLDSEGKLDKDFSKLPAGLGAVSYHLPCHLQAQNIGYKSRDVMRLIPKTRVMVNDRCTAHDGTWAMKTEHFEDSLRLGKKCFDQVEETEPKVVASDCPLAGMQIRQGTGRTVWHPIQIVDAAYRGVALASPVDPKQKTPIPPPRERKNAEDTLKDVKPLTAEDVRKMGHG